VAVGARALDDVAVLVEVHVGRGGQRRLLAEVEEGLAAVGQLHGHEAAAAQVARGGVHHRQRIAHGHGGVDGVAAALEHVDADLAGQVLRVTTMPCSAATGACDAAFDAPAASASTAATAVRSLGVHWICCM
jgi:hypothetical protein